MPRSSLQKKISPEKADFIELFVVFPALQGIFSLIKIPQTKEIEYEKMEHYCYLFSAD